MMARFGRNSWIGGGALAGVGAGALLLALSPASGAQNSLLRLRAAAPVSLGELGTISSFTPATRDARLSSTYARAVLSRTSGKSFRFTPTSGSMSGRRSITVMVRAGGGSLGDEPRAGAGLGVTPLAFSLDAQRGGWRKIALPETAGRKPLDPVMFDLPGYSLEKGKDNSRISASVLLDARRDTGTAPQTLAGENKYSVKVASSYSLTRNLNVTAGVRYAGPDNRLAPITDQRQDDQAVYLGTIFKF